VAAAATTLAPYEGSLAWPCICKRPFETCVRYTLSSESRNKCISSHFPSCSICHKYSTKEMYILDRRKVPKTLDFVTASFPGKRACFFKSVIRRPAGGYIPALHVLLILNVVLPQQNLSNPLDATVASSIRSSPYVLGEIPPKKSQHAQFPHR